LQPGLQRRSSRWPWQWQRWVFKLSI